MDTLKQIKEANNPSQKWRTAKQAVTEQTHEPLQLKETVSNCQTCGQNLAAENETINHRQESPLQNHSVAQSVTNNSENSIQQSLLQNHSVAQIATEDSESSMQQSPLQNYSVAQVATENSESSMQESPLQEHSVAQNATGSTISTMQQSPLHHSVAQTLPEDAESTQVNHSIAQSVIKGPEGTLQKSPLQDHLVAQNATSSSESSMQQSPLQNHSVAQDVTRHSSEFECKKCGSKNKEKIEEREILVKSEGKLGKIFNKFFVEKIGTIAENIPEYNIDPVSRLREKMKERNCDGRRLPQS